MARYFLSLLLLTVLLLLEVNFKSLDVTLYSANCCFLCSVFVLERSHLLVQILVLKNKLPNFLQSQILVLLSSSILGADVVKLVIQRSQSVLVVLNLLCLLVLHVGFRVKQLAILIF